MSKTLIAYYSQSGSTKELVQKLAQRTKSDVVEITVPADTFPSDMFETADVAKEQRKEKKFPPLTSKIPDLKQYDTLITAGPNWSAAVATPVISFLQKIQDFKGRVISLNTSVGQNDEQYNEDFRKQAKNLNVVATINNDGSKLDNYLDK